MEQEEIHIDDFVIREVMAKDFEPLIALYDSVWPKGVDSHRQKAEFVLHESTGVSYIVEKDGKVVGGRSSFYMPIYYGDRKINCVQFADSCIHESCRRKGLFLKMNDAFLHDFFDERKGELVYNISVDNSRKAYEKLGWIYIESLSLFQKYARPWNIFKKINFDIRRLHEVAREDKTTKVEEIDARLLETRAQWFKGKNLIHVDYTHETFKWRMKSGNGIKMYQIPDLGCAIYKIGYKECGVKVLTLGDLFPSSYTVDCVRKLETALRKYECPDIINCYFTLSHPLFGLLKKCHYRGGKRFLNHGVKVVTDEMREICLNPKNWAISFLDIDTF